MKSNRLGLRWMCEEDNLQSGNGLADLAAMYSMWLMRSILWKSRPSRNVLLSDRRPWKLGYREESVEGQAIATNYNFII